MHVRLICAIKFYLHTYYLNLFLSASWQKNLIILNLITKVASNTNNVICTADIFVANVFR